MRKLTNQRISVKKYSWGNLLDQRLLHQSDGMEPGQHSTETLFAEMDIRQEEQMFKRSILIILSKDL